MVNKEHYVEVLREFRKRFRRKRPELFKSGQWHLHQDNARTHKSIMVTNYLTEMGSKPSLTLPTVQICPLVTSGYSQDWKRSSGAAVLRMWRRWRRLWQRPWTHSLWRTTSGPSRSSWSATSALNSRGPTSRVTEVSCFSDINEYRKSLKTSGVYLVCLVKALIRRIHPSKHSN